MKGITKWTTEKEQYLVNHYGILPTNEIAEQLNTTPNILRCRAAYLRKRGRSVRRYPIIRWKEMENKNNLLSLYGTMPTHKIARILNITVSAIHRAVARWSIGFYGNDGRYTFFELGRLLRIDPKSIQTWTKFGLKISGYAKDGRTKPRKPFDRKKEPHFFNALIDIRDLKKFFQLRPEAYNLNRLNSETKQILEIYALETSWKEKLMRCPRCKKRFWTKIYNQNAICPKCKVFAGKWAKKYRS